MPLEQEIAEIERNLAEKRAELERKKQAGELEAPPQEKEILREVVREKIQEHAPRYVPSYPAPQTAPSVSVQHPPSYLSEELKIKVQELVNFVFQKGIVYAVKEAQNTGNPALMDAFHDILVEELYKHLIDRKIIKEF